MSHKVVISIDKFFMFFNLLQFYWALLSRRIETDLLGLDFCNLAAQFIDLGEKKKGNKKRTK